jgi:hypothetical protein
MSDLRNAFRTLGRSPGFAAATIFTLALAIGANTAMFSFGDATAFRPPDVGADRRTILLLIGRQAITMIAPCLVLGAALAYFAMPFFAGAFDFATHDRGTLAAVVLLFTGIALVAALVPARRAARVDPLVALRYE